MNLRIALITIVMITIAISGFLVGRMYENYQTCLARPIMMQLPEDLGND